MEADEYTERVVLAALAAVHSLLLTERDQHEVHSWLLERLAEVVCDPECTQPFPPPERDD